MLQIVHKHMKSVVSVFIVAIVCVAMLGFGVDFFLGGDSGRDYAIKVNEHEISFSEFRLERRAEEDRLRQFLGDQFNQLANALYRNMDQVVSDKLIAKSLVNQMLTDSGFYASVDEVREVVANRLFPQGYSRDRYAGFLRELGATPQTFEGRVRDEMLQAQFEAMVRAASFASEFEVKQRVLSEETKYAVRQISLDSASLRDAIEDPSEAELAEYYDSHAVGYETAEQVSYNYLALHPRSFQDKVEVLDEDVELYYADHQREFVSPERRKIRHIQLNYAEDADPKAMADRKEEAMEIHAKVAAGEDFSQLVLQFSDDITSKGNGGELGWILKGDRDGVFDASVFQQESSGLTELVEADYGFHVVWVDQVDLGGVKPVEEVRAEIIRRIRAEQAPAYVSVAAADYFDEWTSTGNALEEVAKGHDLTVVKGDKLLTERQDPAPLLNGLTRKVLARAEEGSLLIEQGKAFVLVEVVKYEPSTVPELSTVRDKVVSQWKEERAKEELKVIADALLEELRGAETAEQLVTIAAAKGATVKEHKDLQPKANNAPGVLRDFDVQSAVFAKREPQLIERVFHKGERSHVFEVVSVMPPAESELAALMSEYEKKYQAENMRNTIDTITKQLKSKATIDIAASLLSQSGGVG